MLAHITPQNTGEGSCHPGMTETVLENAVAGYHHERMGDVLLDHLFGIGEGSDQPALPSISFEGGRIQALASGNPEHVLVVKAKPFPKALVKDRSFDTGHARNVGYDSTVMSIPRLSAASTIEIASGNFVVEEAPRCTTCTAAPVTTE